MPTSAAGTKRRPKASTKRPPELTEAALRSPGTVPGLRRSAPYLGAVSQSAEQLKSECIRRLDESEGRITRCLELLSHEQIWKRPNANLSSVGNLVLHLCGNVGQWINSTLGGAADLRERDLEFQRTDIPKEELLAALAKVLGEARNAIGQLSEEAITQPYRVQGFQESGTAILVHVVEHFSYHTGQISLHTKLALDVDLGYYSGQDLNAKR